MFNKVNPKQNFPEQEHETIKFWKKNRIFEKSVESKPEDDKYVFYDGPPFITGTPHYGTLLSRIAKDVIPRYWTMNGKRVERQWGWDCHGLPIENKVEKELGLNNRRDIEKIGVDKFIEGCYSYTQRTSADWEWYKDHIGQWVDFENAFKTMDQNSMETVMWVFKTLYEKDLIYEGNRVSLFCTRCGTPVSNFEIAMDDSYDIMNDPAITIKFKVKDAEDTYILAWTTTPWTLPSNRALVVSEEDDYVKVKRTLKLRKQHSAKALLINASKDKVGLMYSEVLDVYSIPGGTIEGEEEVTETVKREVIEETGYQNFEIVDKLGTLRYQFPWANDVNTIKDKTSEVYLVEITGKERVSPKLTPVEKEQKVSFNWYSFDEAIELLDKSVHPGAKKYIETIKEYAQTGELKPFDNSGATIIDEERTEYIILAKPRLENVFEESEYEIVEEFKGKKLVGKEYEPLYDYIPANENDFKVYSYEGMVSMDDGVGIVHSAPGFGDVDTEMGDHYGLTTMFTVDDEGKFINDIEKWAGIYVKKADPQIIQDLRERNLLFKSERIQHRYPYCYRCHTPLIYKAQNSWFLKVNELKDKMLAANEKINWVPEHFKHGRFKKGIESAPDWGISRTRYWATPMPVWRDPDTQNQQQAETIVIGSRDELRELANEPITKLILINSNKPYSEDLSSEDWKNARKLEDQLEGKVDIIISADLQESREMVEPLAHGSKEIEIVTNSNMGSDDLEKQFYERKNNILKKYGVDTLSDIDEEILIQEFKDDIEYIENELKELVRKHEGKVVAISTTEKTISLIRHIVSAKTLRVSFRTNPKKGNFTEIFMDGEKELDLHKPFIDKFTITSPETGKTLKRIFDVCDVWMESGSMPYAMKHYPFEDKKDFEENFPADFVVEYVAQTRAWFYVMHVLSSALFDSNSFKNVVVTGVMAGTDGRKMSKSYGNYPDPKETILKYGADPIRLYFMGSSLMLAEDVSFNETAILDQIKTILLPLWNSYGFFVTYANLKNYEPSPALFQLKTDKENWFEIPFEVKDKLNIWILAKLQQSIYNIRSSFEEYNLPKAAKEYPEFLAHLSKWYIRRSRDKFSSGDKEFLDTLYYVLVEFSKLLAPFAPFITESIYENLVKGQIEEAPESIHLTDFPDNDHRFVERNEKVLAQMDMVRDIVNLGQSLRVQNNLKVRQPLSEIEVKFTMDPDRNYQLEEWMKELIADELNIKTVQEDRNLNDYEGWITAEGENYGLVVSLNTNLTPELVREGILRELQRGIQSQRKRAKMNIGDKVVVEFITESETLSEHFNSIKDTLAELVNASEIRLTTSVPEHKVVKMKDGPVGIKVEKN